MDRKEITLTVETDAPDEELKTLCYAETVDPQKDQWVLAASDWERIGDPDDKTIAIESVEVRTLKPETPKGQQTVYEQRIADAYRRIRCLADHLEETSLTEGRELEAVLLVELATDTLFGSLNKARLLPTDQKSR